MIRYRLCCDNGHAFDEWFDSIADYDRQAEAGTLRCPECGDGGVGKAIMAPNVGASSRADAVPACAGGTLPCGACGMADGD